MIINLKSVSKVSELLTGKIFFFLLFLYQIFFIFFGIDFSDMGLSATLYQQIFSEPKSVEANFTIWFTGIIGGLWLLVFPSSGLIGIRILGVLTFTLMLIVVYNLLKNNFDNNKLKIGLTILTILIGPHFAFMGFHYDTISALFLVTMIFFLFRGLSFNNRLYLLLSGFFLCLNTFSRIPNIAGMAVLMPAIYYGYTKKITMGNYFKTIFSFLSGFAMGLIFILLLMKLLKHEYLYINSFSELLELGKSGNSYDIFSLLKLYFNQYAEMLIMILTGMFAVGIYILAANKFRYKILVVIPFLIALAIYELILQNDFMRVKELLIYHGFAFLFSFICLIDARLNSDEKFLTLLGISMMVILPLGCNYGFINMYGLAFTISMPIAVCSFLSVKPFSINIRKQITLAVNKESITATHITVFSIIVSTALFSSIYYSYCEESKTRLVYKINSNNSCGIYTSKERAIVVNELLAESSKYLKKDDYVLAYNGIPMYYFLTETKPWLYNVWLPAYSQKTLARFIKISYSEKKILPVIVRAKFSIWGNWPEEGLMDDTTPESEWEKHLKETLLEQHNYKLAWENKAFQILIPQGSVKLQ